METMKLKVEAKTVKKLRQLRLEQTHKLKNKHKKTKVIKFKQPNNRLIVLTMRQKRLKAKHKLSNEVQNRV